MKRKARGYFTIPVPLKALRAAIEYCDAERDNIRVGMENKDILQPFLKWLVKERII